MYTAENKKNNSTATLHNNAAEKLPFFQPKLSVNQPNDIYEQEADAMADKVMGMPVNDQPFFFSKSLSVSHVQRKCAHCEEEEKKLQKKEDQTIIQKQDDDENKQTAYQLPPLVPPLSLRPPFDAVDYLGMRQPFMNRGLMFPGSYMNSATQEWARQYGMYSQFGAGNAIGNSFVGGALNFFGVTPPGGDWNAWLANNTTPMAVDSALSHDFPNMNEQEERRGGLPAPHMFNLPALHFKKENSSEHSTDVEALLNTEKYLNKLSGGKPLGEEDKSFFESRIGYDFSDVKIHNDSSANQSAESVNALAYTNGNNIVFGSNQYQPNTDSGKHLLAHELTHTIQQKSSVNIVPVQRTIGDGHDLTSRRFAGDATLEDVYDSNAQLSRGSIGDSVTKVQHALQDDGVFLPLFGIDGNFEAETERAVTTYQRRKSITTDTAGHVGVATITALNNDFPTVTDSAATLSQNPADVACIEAILCPWNRALINDFASGKFHVILVDRLFWADEKFDGTGWVPNPMEGAGETSSGTIRIRSVDRCDTVAQALYHEYQHARSPHRLRSASWADEEKNAYTIETAWSISRGLTPDPSLVTTDPATGAQTVNPAGVQSQVGTYPGMVAGAGEEVIAKVGADHVRVRRANGTVYERAAANGDTVPGSRQVVNPRPVAATSWICP
ncbi:MAG: DUF4157 domain-containing protein [Parafilimonas sp.]